MHFNLSCKKITHHFQLYLYLNWCLGILLDDPGWWSQHSYDEFNTRAYCVVDAYQSLVVNELPNLDKPKVDGHLTSEENLADIGGNRFAYFAYSKWIYQNVHKSN